MQSDSQALNHDLMTDDDSEIGIFAGCLSFIDYGRAASDRFVEAQSANPKKVQRSDTSQE